MDFPKLIAHRGLHSDAIPENSLAAFKAAAKSGYAIELDVRLTADCRLVVFHDEDLKRMCNVEGKISHFTYEQLCCFRLLDSDERIPLLSDVLKLVNGSVPLLIEVKNGESTFEIQKRLTRIMKGYKGKWAVQSFNPFTIMLFRLFAKDVKRGVLISQFLKEKDVNSIVRYLCSFPVVWKTLAKPDFISCDLRSISFTQIEQAFNAGADLFTWTAKGKELINEALKFSDSVIFENY